ncbi:hypothetical protein HanPSC8_Chr14g0595341 [Helianthus annuus]|nr:hypothetical protein HanIR_Chr14g0671171 [Helianthus annuus]KAJ0838483.1 hypothetical protein HanPSC8_Chr14g0595341 [Helianthus annuus]
MGWSRQMSRFDHGQIRLQCFSWNRTVQSYSLEWCYCSSSQTLRKLLSCVEDADY